MPRDALQSGLIASKINMIDALNYIEQNKDWLKFNSVISDNTGLRYKKMWLDNARSNIKRVVKSGWACSEYQEKHEGKIALLLGGSPAITKQFDQIRGLQHDKDFVLVGITSNIRMLLNNGIRPEFVMIADADPAMTRFWDGMDLEQTKGINLIANLCTHPDMLNKWKGNIKYLAIHTDVKELVKLMKQRYNPVNDCGALFPAVSSQYNVGAAFAYLVLGCRTLIFVGNELGFPDKEAPYYPDRKDYKDAWVRNPHPDIYGKTVYTNYMLFSLKLALEDFLGKLSGNGWFINATESGIFGVSKRYGNTPWIYQLTLDWSIKQAKHIKAFGEPLFSPNLIH